MAESESSQIDLASESLKRKRTKTVKVLVVDDHLAVRELITEVLESAGYEVTAATEGKEAVARTQEDVYDLVLLDVVMPGMGGAATLASMLELRNDIVVIIMTAYGTIEDAVSFLKQGAVDYITKPFVMDEVLHKVDRALKEKWAKFEAIVDSKTELFNHRHFMARLEEELIRANRYLRPLGLVMIDIDDFKKFNDENGHLLGDEVLGKLSQILKAHCRESDIAARYGGEEFAIILPETDLPNALAVSERIRESVDQTEFPHREGTKWDKVTISSGVTSISSRVTDSIQAEDLIDLADRALYDAKRSGKNRSCVSPQVETRSETSSLSR